MNAKPLRAALIVVVVASAAATATMAQRGYSPYPVVESRASTVGESHARGMSDIIGAAGQANLNNSEAAINYEEARSKNLDNRVKGTNTYFENRRINAEARAAMRGPRPTTEQMFRMAKNAAPAPLTHHDLDPLTGQIAWPLLLQSDEYAKYREDLDKLFAERAKNGRFASFEQFTQMRQLTQQMDAALKQRVRDYPPQSYARAKAFLRSLTNELNQLA